jgi:glycine/D-amino acid oxidase-like deaminating enzyme
VPLTAASPRVLVVGAGITGLATAGALTRRGHAVTVLDTAARGTGASDRSLAWLNSFGTTDEAYHRFRVQGLAAYAELARSAAGNGVPLGVHLDGALWWPSPEDAGAWPATRERLARFGYPFEELSAQDVRARFPEVAADRLEAGFAVHVPQEGWADLPGLVAGFAAEVEAGGGQLLAVPGPVRLRASSGRVVGVDIGPGASLPADAVVVAAGGATPGLLARDTGFTIPVDPQTGLLVRSRPFAGAPRVVLNTPAVSLRPEPGGGVAFDTDWPEGTVVLGPEGRATVDEDAVAQVAAAAREVLTAGAGLQVDRWDAGVKPVPADGLPVVGPVPGTAGCWVAYLHSGATNALVLAERLAAAVLGEEEVPAFLSTSRLSA